MEQIREIGAHMLQSAAQRARKVAPRIRTTTRTRLPKRVLWHQNDDAN